jgi:hypothetical protein
MCKNKQQVNFCFKCKTFCDKSMSKSKTLYDKAYKSLFKNNCKLKL